MQQAGMDGLVNFVILSDHGMTYGANPTVPQHPFANFPYEQYSVKQVSMEAALRPVGRQVRMVIGSFIFYSQKEKKANGGLFYAIDFLLL